MPEGDTIRRAARALGALVGERLSVVAVHPRAQATGVADRLDGRELRAVEAHGKNLFLVFDGGLVLRSHLGMTGNWRVLPAGAAVVGSPWLVLEGRHEKAVLRGGSRLELSRRGVVGLGPDILGDPLDARGIVASLRRAEAHVAIGEALLDQRLVAGIGNIWRCEALWAATTSPWLPAAAVGDRELMRVVEEAARLMRLSVDGRRPPHQVYRRAGRPCPRCGTSVESRRQGEQARTTYWCPRCQPLERGDGGDVA